MDRIQKPFESREDFLHKDLKINKMVIDTTLYSLAGLALGAIIFKGKVPMGYCGGAAGVWALKDHIGSSQKWIILYLSTILFIT